VEQRRGGPVVIRPMGVGEVLDGGIRLARGNYRILVLTAAWGLVPLVVIGAIINLLGGGTQQIVATIVRNPALALVFFVLGIAGFIMFSLSYVAVTLACSRLITGETAPEDLRAGVLYRLALGRLGAYVLLLILYGILAVPLIILFPLGIFLVVRWSVSSIALVIERAGPLASLGRSWDLTRGSWWHTLGAFVVGSILLIIVDYVALAIFAAIGAAFSFAGVTLIGAILTSIANLLASLLTTPFSLAIYVVLYYELRARREGFDLAMRAQQTPSV
jgi:hypothetical protein